MQITLFVRLLSTLGGLGLIGVAGYVNILHTHGHDMQIVVGALAAGTALAAWVLSPMLYGGRRLLAALALLGVFSGELYGFVQTSERLLSARNARQSLTATENQTWVQRNAALEYAVDAAKTECKVRGPRCAAAEAKVDEKRSILAGTQVPVPPSPIASLLGWTPEIVEIIPTLAGSIGLNLLGFVMLTFGHSRKRNDVVIVPVKAITEEPTLPSDAELEQLRRLLFGRKRPMTNQQIAEALSLSKGEASKRVSKAVAAGLVKRETRGREVAVTLH